MLRSFLTFVIAATAAFAAARDARGETVNLRTGETLVGDVRLDGDDVVIDARYPIASVVRVRKDALVAESLYEVLERRTDTKDAAGRRTLGEVAEQLGLRGAAVVEYGRVRDLDPTSQEEMGRRISRLGEGISTDLLDDAQELLSEGMASAALVRLQAILQRFPETNAATTAKALVPKAEADALGASKPTGQHLTAEESAKAADALEKDLSQAEKTLESSDGHVGASGSRELRAAQRAIELLERAWSHARRLVDVSGDATLTARVSALRERTKSALVSAYLRAGTILIQRRAIPGAERYCDKACELDPANASIHELHRIVLTAKALSPGRSGPVAGH